MSDNVLTAKVTINGASYIITSEGKVFGAYGQSISIRPNTSGYASFTAGRKGRRINVMLHRLVAELFIPNPNNYSDVDHLDSNPMNPHKENLDWCSHPENVRRAYDRGHHIGKAVGEKKSEGASYGGDCITAPCRISGWCYHPRDVRQVRISLEYNW